MPSASNTDVTIVNMSLAHIKSGSISSFADQTEQAQKAALFYHPARRAALRQCRWKFASRSALLALLGDVQTAQDNPTDQTKQDIVPGWLYSYKYPGQCVKVWEVYNPDYGNFPDVASDRSHWTNAPQRLIKPAKYEVAVAPVSQQQAIATNLASASVRFNFDETDESRFDDMFIDGFAYELALKLCMPLTANLELMQQIAQSRKEFMEEAKRINGGESTEEVSRDSRYLRARAS